LLTTTTMQKVACPITRVREGQATQEPGERARAVAAGPRRPAVLHRLPDLPPGVLLLNG
jgi:hypothetical protein